MLTDNQLATLHAARTILRNYRVAANWSNSYMEGWRHGKAEEAAQAAATSLATVLYYESKGRSVEESADSAEPDSAELETHSDPQGRCE